MLYTIETGHEVGARLLARLLSLHCHSLENVAFLASSWLALIFSWRFRFYFLAMSAHDHCCVSLCTNRRDKNKELSFHSFPIRDGAPRKRWIIVIRREEGEFFVIMPSTVVCSSHFSDDEFVKHAVKSAAGTRTCRRLKPTAVPSLRPLDKPTELKEREAECARLKAKLEGSQDSERPADPQKIIIFSFENLWAAEDGKMLEFYTGQTQDMWSSLWRLLNAPDNTQRKQLASTETSGRQRPHTADIQIYYIFTTVN